MTEISTLTYFGAAGIGLAWGWWCSMRFSAVKIKWLNVLAVVFGTTGITAMTRWLADWPSGLILILSACVAAFFHYMWMQQLRKQYP